MNTLKIVLIGDTKVGKTTFLNLLQGNVYDEYHVPTLGVEVQPILRGNKCFNVWDCSGDDRFRGLGDGYYIQAQGAIVMCDSTNIESIKNIEKWSKEFKRVAGDVPIVYVLNKSEEPSEFWDKRFIRISCKTNTNIEEVLNRF